VRKSGFTLRGRIVDQSAESISTLDLL